LTGTVTSFLHLPEEFAAAALGADSDLRALALNGIVRCLSGINLPRLGLVANGFRFVEAMGRRDRGYHRVVADEAERVFCDLWHGGSPRLSLIVITLPSPALGNIRSRTATVRLYNALTPLKPFVEIFAIDVIATEAGAQANGGNFTTVEKPTDGLNADGQILGRLGGRQPALVRVNGNYDRR